MSFLNIELRIEVNEDLKKIQITSGKIYSLLLRIRSNFYSITPRGGVNLNK